MSITQVQKVRILYKTILKLHRGLPEELQVLGNGYVKDEFKRHKKCTEMEANIFMKEWTNYALDLAKQLGLGFKGPPKPVNEIGSPLSEPLLENFRHEQLVQLYELMLATKGIEDDEFEKNKKV